ncbi:Heat shock factor protein 2 [Globisporangium polare]
MCMRSASESTATTEATTRTNKNADLLLVTRVPKFLRCLYDILHAEDPSILAWSRDGSFFEILSTERLEDKVLPKYFKHSKFASFQRQLNNFGFRKWTKTQSSVCTFSHGVFVRRHPSELVELVIAQNELAAQDEAMVKTTSATTTAATKKRRRSVDAVDRSSESLLPFKRHHASATFCDGFPHTELSFQEQLSFHVESWDLAPISSRGSDFDLYSHPVYQQQPCSHTFKHEEDGNETPTSAGALNEPAFKFTTEELNTLLFTVSKPHPQQQYECYYTSMEAFVV